MDIRIAKEEDIASAMRIIEDCIEDLKSRGIEQWGDYYPDMEVLENDIRCRSLYVIGSEGDCAGIISFDENTEPECRDVDWVDHGRVLVVHRLAISPGHQGKGLGRELMGFAEGFAAEHKYSSIRLNAYSDNRRAVDFYRQRGYVKRGEVYFPNRDLPFYCLEKVL